MRKKIAKIRLKQILIVLGLLLGDSFADSQKISITSQNAIHFFDLRVAKTPLEREKGLMHQKKMGDTEGMIFFFPHKEKVCFWMKQTHIPLDILMLNEAGEIVDILYKMSPFSKKRRCSSVSVLTAIELKAGICHDKGIKQGDRIALIP